MLCVDEKNSKCTYPEEEFKCYELDEKNKDKKVCSVPNSQYSSTNYFCQCEDAFIGSGYTECVNGNY